eukprot:Pgem_evm1s10227
MSLTNNETSITIVSDNNENKKDKIVSQSVLSQGTLEYHHNNVVFNSDSDSITSDGSTYLEDNNNTNTNTNTNTNKNNSIMNRKIIQNFKNKFVKANEKAFKFDMKLIMAAERTFMKYVQFALTMATFALMFDYTNNTNYNAAVTILVTGVVLAADMMVIYATVIYHLRRSFIIGNLEKKGIVVPKYFNDWIG